MNIDEITPSKGFSVRQSEEIIKNLRKENFNLKLKMYLMEAKTGVVLQTFNFSKTDDKEFIDLFMENEIQKIQLEDQQNLLKASLDAIRKVELEKTKYQKKYYELFQMHRRTKPLVTSKSLIIKNRIAIVSKKNLKIENKHLREKISRLEAQFQKNQLINDLSNFTELSDSKQYECQGKFCEMKKLLDEPTEKKFSDLEKENECLKKSLEEMSLKCHKMEQAEEDSERLINEQTKLMKALNRIVEAKNEELIEHKSLFNRSRVSSSSSSSDIYKPESFSLIDSSSNKLEYESTDYPFYNPLFGKEFESLYR